MEGGFIPEVIAPETGARLAPGATGELVLTNLGRVGSPLLRYRTGDLVHWSAEARCLCGRYEMALEGGILGRTDDMAVVRGVNLYPSAVEAVVRQFAEVAEYRAELYTERAMQEIRLCIEPSAHCANPAQLAHDLEVALRAAFNLRVPIQLAPPGSLPRFELKAQRWVRS
jgi:phenylacetate-CoA ligase